MCGTLFSGLILLFFTLMICFRFAAGIPSINEFTEASGGVRLDTIRAIAETGVTFISVGRLTQSAPAADIGLDFAMA